MSQETRPATVAFLGADFLLIVAGMSEWLDHLILFKRCWVRDNLSQVWCGVVTFRGRTWAALLDKCNC